MTTGDRNEDRPAPPAHDERSSATDERAAATEHSAGAADMMSVDARRVVLIGTVGFALAFVVLLPFWSWLGEHDHRVWLWTSLTGALLGLVSLPLVDRHRRMGRLG